jgi:hypothetical protein
VRIISFANENIIKNTIKGFAWLSPFSLGPFLPIVPGLLAIEHLSNCLDENRNKDFIACNNRLINELPEKYKQVTEISTCVGMASVSLFATRFLVRSSFTCFLRAAKGI